VHDDARIDGHAHARAAAFQRDGRRNESKGKLAKRIGRATRRPRECRFDERPIDASRPAG
jgi:hypothetical protein